MATNNCITKRRKTAIDLAVFKMGIDENGNGDTPQQSADEEEEDLSNANETKNSSSELDDSISPPTPVPPSSSNRIKQSDDYEASNDDKTTKKGLLKYLFIAAVTLFFLYLFFTCSLSTETGVPSKRAKALENLKRLQTEFPSQGSKFWNSLKAGMKDLMLVNKPLVALFIHTPEDSQYATCLARKVMKSIDPSAPSVNLSSMENFEDYGNVVELLRREISKVKGAVLEGLHNLPGHLALALHSVCDRETPLVTESVVIMTLQVKSLDRDGAEEVLTDLWKEHLCEDRLPALMIRVASMVLPVDSHKVGLPELCSDI